MNSRIKEQQLRDPSSSPEPVLGIEEAPPENKLPSLQENPGVVRAAVVLALANVIQRVLGLIREMVKASLFSPAELSAFEIAAIVPSTLFDLIIGGMVNSSLVPIFSDYAEEERREELWQIVSTFLSVAGLLLVLVAVAVSIFAPWVAGALGAYNLEQPGLTALSIRLTRLVTQVLLFMGLSSILSGVLYALKRFTLPAFTAMAYNATIVVVALLRHDHIDSLVWGMLIGSLFQIIIQLPALRDARLRWNFNWRHPVIGRILRLYAPIVLGLLVNQAGVAVGYHLATLTGDASLTYMRFATTLYQFPLGLVVTALSMAILPTLSQQATAQPLAFKNTLAGGIRLVLALILPATAGLFTLAGPIVALVFQRGEFGAADAATTALVLQIFLFGLPFAAVDQMLIFASYARKNTLQPALVGVASIIVYVAVALLLLNPLGLLSLMVADAVKHFVHTLLMIAILHRQLDGMGEQGIMRAAFKSVLGALLTGAGAAVIAALTGRVIEGSGQIALLIRVGTAGMGGVAIYAAAVYLLDIQEVRSLRRLLHR